MPSQTIQKEIFFDVQNALFPQDTYSSMPHLQTKPKWPFPRYEQAL